MEKFNILKGIPANLPMINVDTDMIIPKQFLKTIKRNGLGKSLFFEMRYDEQGKKIDNFVLNKEPYNKSSILLTGKNFGCGSSREHAPWALLDFGIKCIIGLGFADIFYNNCFKNGMLPIVLSQNNLEEIIEYSKRKEMVEINLTKQEIKFGNKIINFEIDSFKKECLLNGLDDISLSLEKSKKISSYEENLKTTKPWSI
jgi:3-isopropylmalate/(R)-2-methylmalate dehydratase small subunit